MTPESIFAEFAPTALREPLNYARQKMDDRLRKKIQDELKKIALSSLSNSITIVNIHIGDLVQEFHLLAESGLPPDAIIEASRSQVVSLLCVDISCHEQQYG